MIKKNIIFMLVVVGLTLVGCNNGHEIFQKNSFDLSETELSSFKLDYYDYSEGNINYDFRESKCKERYGNICLDYERGIIIWIEDLSYPGILNEAEWGFDNLEEEAERWTDSYYDEVEIDTTDHGSYITTLEITTKPLIDINENEVLMLLGKDITLTTEYTEDVNIDGKYYSKGDITVEEDTSFEYKYYHLGESYGLLITSDDIESEIGFEDEFKSVVTSVKEQLYEISS